MDDLSFPDISCANYQLSPKWLAVCKIANLASESGNKSTFWNTSTNTLNACYIYILYSINQSLSENWFCFYAIFHVSSFCTYYAWFVFNRISFALIFFPSEPLIHTQKKLLTWHIKTEKEKPTDMCINISTSVNLTWWQRLEDRKWHLLSQRRKYQHKP